MRRRKRPQLTENHERWLVSYADFITLLFAFFVVMYSTAAVNVGSFRVLSDSIVRAFGLPGVSFDPTRPAGDGTRSSSLGTPSTAAADAARVPLQAAGNARDESAPTRRGDPRTDAGVQGVKAALQSAVGDLAAPERLAISAGDAGVEIRIPARMLFPSGSPSLLADSVPLLRRLARTLSALPNDVVVEGHTDDQPIRNGRFPSNWELSTARAAAVTRLLDDEGVDPTRLSAVGFGENRPIAANDSDEGRAENRRVVIVVRSAAPGEVGDDG